MITLHDAPMAKSNLKTNDLIPFDPPKELTTTYHPPIAPLPADSTELETIQHIKAELAKYYGINFLDMESSARPEHIAWPRQVAMWMLRAFMGISLVQIGRHFGGRDHGTVLHAWRLVEDRMDTESGTRAQIQMLATSLGFPFRARAMFTRKGDNPNN